MAVVLALVVGIVVLVVVLSGASVASGKTALAEVETMPLAGSVEHVSAWDRRGRPVPVALADGQLTPLRKVRPGEELTIRVRIHRPGWLGWALGSEQVEQLTIRAPVARVSQEVIAVSHHGDVRVSFSSPVSAVAFGSGGELHRRLLSAPSSTVSLGALGATGTVEVAAAARRWERLGAPERVSWFPAARRPVLATLPAPGSNTSPAGTLYLTFSRPVATVLKGARPRLTPSVPGTWREPSSHTLVFSPAGSGAPMDSEISMDLPHAVAVSTGGGLVVTTRVHWHVPGGSLLRLQQLLAQAGYLPLRWHSAGAEVAHTPSAELTAAVAPPRGSFSWRYANTPHQLEALWSPGAANVMTRGAIMRFEESHNITPDGEAGAAVWKALLDDAMAGTRSTEPYSYVYVHRAVPETATLWTGGRTLVRTPANTGVPGAETELGTFPVFEHLPEGTMTGTDPNGTHYKVQGVKWISYFNGGDALHYYVRASYGSPQSNGCVEMPEAAAAEIWPHTPIGTLVTVES